MHLVLLFANYREAYRRPLLHENELYCSHVAKEETGVRHSPEGAFDVAAYLKTLPAPWNDPSLLLVSYDNLHLSIPQNLAAVKCPKILVMGDTHHQVGPIQHALYYLRAEPFDLVILEFDRHHLHFLLEAGIHQARWLPAFSLSPFEYAPGKPYTHAALFMGNADHHPYRRHVLMEMERRCKEYQMGSGPREDVARVFSETQVNLNISLNADLNLRIFEVLAAGGLLLTDRLSPESGLELLFQDRRHLVICDHAEQFLEQTGYYLTHPAEARAIAAAGHEQYLRQHRPEHKIADLMALLEGRVRDEYDLRLDRRTALPPDNKDALANRLALYEIVQEAHRVNVEYKVLFWSGPERAASDVIDLPRVKVTVVRDMRSGAPNALQTAGLEDRVEWLDPLQTQFTKSQWNMLFCNQADAQSPLFERLRESQAADATGVVDTWEAPPIRPYL